MSKAVCLVSGGLDSCVSLAVAHSRKLELALLHVTYGQLTAEREERAFREIAAHYRIHQQLVVAIPHLRQIGGSALTDRSIPLPVGDPDRPDTPVSYVPFRNANLLAIAVSWAEVLGADFIYLGAVEEDSSGYPDCRDSFFQAFQKTIDTGTRDQTSIQIVTPLIHLNKGEIVSRGLRLAAPLRLTWSCYRESARACGRCDSCLLRLRGFQQAGFHDPIPYQSISSPQPG